MARAERFPQAGSWKAKSAELSSRHVLVEFAYPIRRQPASLNPASIPADKPPSGANWIHEIKHDGYRLMARRDPVGIRLLTRNGNDWANRYPLIVEAVNQLKVRSS